MTLAAVNPSGLNVAGAGSPLGPLTVACVNFRNYQGRGVEYVERLWRACEHYVPKHRFVCLTDNLHERYPLGVELRELPYIELGNNPGYWVKVGLFKPGVLAGRVLYLDLDVIINEPLRGLVALLDESPGLWALDDFEYPLNHPKLHLTPAQQLKLGGMPGTCNSSVMLWEGEVAADVWNEFNDETRLVGLGGDQNWVTLVLGDGIKLIPEGWAHSYRLGGVGAITVFHGSPKPHEVAWK